jgi:hypothetical protein
MCTYVLISLMLVNMFVFNIIKLVRVVIFVHLKTTITNIDFILAISLFVHERHTHYMKWQHWEWHYSKFYGIVQKLAFMMSRFKLVIFYFS